MTSAATEPLHAQPDPTGQDAPRPVAGAALIVGQVVDEATGDPIPDVRVRWGVLASRGMPRQRALVRAHEVRADDSGRFRIEVREPDAARPVSLDVLAPGHGSAVGPSGRGIHPQSRVIVAADQVSPVTLRVRPAMYVAGTVRDVHGEPIAGVEVEATERDDQGYSCVAVAVTDAQGRFEIFDFVLPRAPGVPPDRAHLTFEHPDFLGTEVDDCHALAAAEREGLAVVLHRGWDLAGRVPSPDGRPVAGLLVEAFDAAGQRVRAVDVDVGGGFAATGLPEGRIRLRVIDAAALRKGTLDLDLYAHERGLEIALVDLAVRAPPRQRLLGLELVDVTPALRSGLEVDAECHVVVVGTDDDHLGLGIGALRPGDALRRVGSRGVTSVRDVVEAILEEAARRGGNEAVALRVVYAFRRANFAGSNTQSMRVTQAQVSELRRWLAEQL